MKIIELLDESNVGDFNRVQNYLDSRRIPNKIILRGLAAEARKAGSLQQFEQDYIGQIKHGLYWHWTNEPNFVIDPKLGPRDMSSMGDGQVTPNTLMITSDLPYWSNYGPGGKSRPYVALIDMTNVPRDAYRQVNRGFGNEFFVSEPSAARVLKVMQPRQALRLDVDQHKWIPQSFTQLTQFYHLATGTPENAGVNTVS